MSFLCAGLFSTVLYVFLAICILLLMVLIHEVGHYVVGRMLGFKITEFSIGFGKAIFTKINKRGEKISLRIFPLGGYCAFEGEGDDDEDDDIKTEKLDKNGKKKEYKKSETKNLNVDKKETTQILSEINEITTNDIDKIKEKKPYNKDAFNNQKAWKRLLVYGAGVFFNFLSAIVFSFILLVSYGYDIPQAKLLSAGDLQCLQNNTILIYSTQLNEDDVIVKVNGQRVSILTGTLSQHLSSIEPNTDFTITVKSNNQEKEIVVQYKVYNQEEGISEYSNLYSMQPYKHSFFEALGRSFEVSIGFAWVVLKGFWQIITGQIAFSQLGGPISTIGMISTITQSGFMNFLILLPLLSANLAVFNFLPIPALDGSHAVFTLLEWIFGKPVVSRKVENYIHFYGLLVLLLFVIVVDIVHIAVVGL